MGLFGDKDALVYGALGAGGAFDKDKKTDPAIVFGAALGASVAGKKNWTMKDSARLYAAIQTSNAWKKKYYLRKCCLQEKI